VPPFAALRILCYDDSLVRVVTQIRTFAVAHRDEKYKIQKRRGMEVKVYVGNLSYATTEDDLRTLFAQAGTVKSVALIKDRDTGRSKGFAFVEFETQVDAQKAISMFNGQQLGDREINVNLARPREERGGRGGRGGGRGGRSGGGYGGGGDRW
jgi:RNA recognition motif-containing protein